MKYLLLPFRFWRVWKDERFVGLAYCWSRKGIWKWMIPIFLVEGNWLYCGDCMCVCDQWEGIWFRGRAYRKAVQIYGGSQ